MKHTVLLFFACIAICGRLHAQYYYSVIPAHPPTFDTFINTPGITIGQITDSLHALLDPTDTSEGGPADEWKVFKKFWEVRAGGNDYSGHNMFRRYYEALRTTMLAGRGCGGGGYQGAWECIGPDNVPTQTVGRVDAIWADPSDSNYILAGTPGGLFKTTNGGFTWACITDNTPLAVGIWGINAIAVDPANKNNIVLATGNNTSNARGGAGILISYDGGSTWQQTLIGYHPTYTYEDSIQDIDHVFLTPDGSLLYAFMGDQVYVNTMPVAAYSLWTNITPPAAIAGCSWADLQFDPADQNHFFMSSASPYCGGRTAIWEATDAYAFGGWNNITSTFTDVVAGSSIAATDWQIMDISMPDADTLYFIALDILGDGGLYEYCVSAHQIYALNHNLPVSIISSSTLGLNISRFELSVSNAATSNNGGKRNMYFGSGTPFMSYDGGASFTEIGQYNIDWSPAITHGDIRSVFIQHATNTSHGTGDIVFFATDGGVSKKSGGVNPSVALKTSTIDISGKGLNCGTFWGFSTSDADGLGIGGMMHDGTATYEPSLSQQWTNVGASDAWQCTTNTSSPSTGYTWEWDNKLELTSNSGGRKMGAITGFTNPYDPDFMNIQVGSPVKTDFYGTIYNVQNGFYRKLTTDATFFDMHTLMGFPNTNGVDGAFIALNRYNTDFEGYVLYYSYASHTGQYLYYRNSSNPSFTIADSIPVPPGTTWPAMPVTTLATDPANTENVWAAVGGLNENNYSDGTRNRVQYSPDHGTTWIDISNGLPQRMPVTQIVYDEASHYLYCTTDAGVYMYDFSSYVPGHFTNTDGNYENSSVSWTCFSAGKIAGHDFPNAMVTDLQINHCTGKLYAATFGRSIWSTDLLPAGTALPTQVTIGPATPPWSGPVFPAGNIDVPAGATLTLSGCTLFMPKDGKIMVEPGGHLSVVNSTITNNCDQCFWKGIEARGDATQPQDPIHQAWVSIQNSLIQHAVIGVANSNRDIIWSTNGGIIQCMSSSFVNNQTDIAFEGYDNYWSDGSLHPNISYFSSCAFLVNDNYKGNTLGIPKQHMVSLHNVEGISFAGCSFINRDHNAANIGQGIGIDAFKTGFSVTAICPIFGGLFPPSMCFNPQYSRFCGLGIGISMTTDNYFPLSANVDQANFDSCSIGEYISGFDNATTTRCNFNIGLGRGIDSVYAPALVTCGQNIGILAQNLSQLTKIEGNNFNGKRNGVYDWYNYGAVIGNIPQTNTIYRNSFDTLDYGVYSVGKNNGNIFASDGYTIVAITSLQISCNAFVDNTNDIYIVKDSLAVWPQGIEAQLLGPSPAGNTFTASTNNIINNAPNSFGYWYTAGHSNEIPNTSGITKTLVYGLIVAPPSCASSFYNTFSPGSVYNANTVGMTTALNIADLSVHKTTFNNNKVAYANALSTYSSALDFGNTTTLLGIIDTSTVPFPLYALLSSGAPYLSKTALKATANLNLLSYSQMMNVLLENPDNLGDYNFLSYVNNDYHFTMPDMSTLIAAETTITDRTRLEDTMSVAKFRMATEGNIIISALKSAWDTSVNVYDTTHSRICTDTNNVYYGLDSNKYYAGIDSVDVWLQSIGGLWTHYERTGYYDFIGQHTVADSIFSGIASLVAVGDSADSVTYASYTTLRKVINGAKAANRDEFSLDSAEVASLTRAVDMAPTFNTGDLMMWEITGMYTAIVGGGGLTGGGLFPPPPSVAVYCPPYEGGRHSHGYSAIPQTPIININGPVNNNQFSAYPNPASGVVTFSYNVQDGSSSVRILVTNILGEKVADMQPNGRAGNAYWDPGHEPAGVYIYTASDDKGMITKGKLVIVR